MMLGRSLLAALLMAMCALFTMPVAAQQKTSVASLIKKGQGLFDDQRYEESIQTLSAALLRPTIAKEEKIQVYQLLAYNYIVLNRTEEADGAVRGLLVIDAEYKLPETESPRFREFFEKVRKDWEDEGRPGVEVGAPQPGVSKAKIKHAVPDSANEDEDVAVTGSIEDPDKVIAELTLSYRTGSKGKFASRPVNTVAGKFSAQIPATAVTPPLIEYYIEARNKEGLPVATRGDADTPLRVAVTDEFNIVASPALWVPVGIVIAAGVTLGVLFGTGIIDVTGDSEVNVNVFESAPTNFTFRF